MTESQRVGDAGRFAADPRPSRVAIAAVVLATAALVVALIRPLTGASAAFSSAATWLGMAAIGAGIAALYLTGTRGIRGRSMAKTAVAAGACAALYAFIDAAVRDGALDLARFGDQYFNGDILRTLPGDFARGALNTIKLAFAAQFFAIAVGLLVAMFAISPKPWAHYPAVVYVDLIRGLPLVVLTFLIHFGLPNVGITLGAFVSPVVILTVNASAYIAEIFRAGIQSLPRGQMEAARSLGMPHTTAMLSVVVPQAGRTVIPPLVSEFIALVKDTAIVIALIGFTTATRDLFGAARTSAASTFSPTPYMAAGIVYLAITVPLARLVGVLERRLRVKSS